jgi:hypothetical protein
MEVLAKDASDCMLSAVTDISISPPEATLLPPPADIFR